MDLKKKTKEELEHKIHEIEKLIAKKGIGSSYLKKVERAQRNINLMILSGVTITLLGVAAWIMLNKDDEDQEKDE